MLVCPASRGKGTRMFEDSQELELVEATAFENGLALLRYEIKNPDSAHDSGLNGSQRTDPRRCASVLTNLRTSLARVRFQPLSWWAAWHQGRATAHQLRAVGRSRTR